MKNTITNNYFEKNGDNYKKTFSRPCNNSELTTKTVGHVTASLFNSKSERKAVVSLSVHDEDKDVETKIDISPEVAYWVGKCLIDFAENAVHINHFYNQESKADE